MKILHDKVILSKYEILHKWFFNRRFVPADAREERKAHEEKKEKRGFAFWKK